MEPSVSSKACIEPIKTQDKCRQTKLYCEDFIQSFNELMRKCRRDTLFRLYCKVVYELVTRVHGLCRCGKCLVELKGVINHLCSSCAQYIISDDFSSVPESFRLNLSDALQAAQEELGCLSGDRFFRLAGLCVAPWSHPFLVGIMEGTSGSQGSERTQNYISYEGIDLLSSRVEILLEKDPNKAIRLCQACAEHQEIGKDTVFLETCLVVLFNQGMPPEFSMQVWIQESERVLESLKNMLMYYPAPVIKLVDTLLLKEWNQEHSGLKEEKMEDLLRMWIDVHYKHGSFDELYRAAVNLAMYNDDTKSVIHFADTIVKQIGQEALPLFVNLLVDNIQVPFHRLDEIECQLANQNNAVIGERLADALCENTGLECLCRMANFVSCPSKQNYLKLKEVFEAAKENYKQPIVPLLSSRLDLILTKVILGLLPKAFNPWNSWDSLEQVCNKLQRTSKQVKTNKGNGILNEIVTYKKPNWFLDMLEDDWACYAKGKRNEAEEVVCNDDEIVADEPANLEPANSQDLDAVNKASNDLKTNEIETNDLLNNVENKVKKKRGRKSLKDGLVDGNIKRRFKRDGDENKGSKKEADKNDGCKESPKPRKKPGRKRKADKLKDNIENNDKLDVKDVKEINNELNSKDLAKSTTTLDNGSADDPSAADTVKKIQKGGKKRRRQRDDFGIGRRRRKPNRKTSDEKGKLKGDEDELDDSETDEEPMSDVKTSNSTAEMISLNLQETPINRCCLTQLETPPPDTNSCLPSKPDPYKIPELNTVHNNPVLENGEMTLITGEKKDSEETLNVSPKKKVKKKTNKSQLNHKLDVNKLTEGNNSESLSVKMSEDLILPVNNANCFSPTTESAKQVKAPLLFNADGNQTVLKGTNDVVPSDLNGSFSVKDVVSPSKNSKYSSISDKRNPESRINSPKNKLKNASGQEALKDCLIKNCQLTISPKGGARNSPDKTVKTKARRTPVKNNNVDTVVKLRSDTSKGSNVKEVNHFLVGAANDKVLGHTETENKDGLREIKPCEKNVGSDINQISIKKMAEVQSEGTNSSDNKPVCTGMLKASAAMRRTHSRVLELSMKKSMKKKQCSEEPTFELDEVSGFFRDKVTMKPLPKHCVLECHTTGYVENNDFEITSQESEFSSDKLDNEIPKTVNCTELQTSADMSPNKSTEMNGLKSDIKKVRRKGKRQVNELKKDDDSSEDLETRRIVSGNKTCNLLTKSNSEENDVKKKRTCTLSSKRTVYETRSLNQKRESSPEPDKNASVSNKNTDKSPNKRTIAKSGSGMEAHKTRLRQKNVRTQNVVQAVDSVTSTQSVSESCKPMHTNLSNDVLEISDSCQTNQGSGERVRYTSGERVRYTSGERVHRTRRLTDKVKSPIKSSNIVNDCLEELIPIRLESVIKNTNEPVATFGVGKPQQPRRICTRQSSGGNLKSNSLVSLVQEAKMELKAVETNTCESKKQDEQIAEDKPLFKDIKRYTRERKSL
ncbi:uncharacterized protein [Antedon mediterranea]|uniref:uncharacterized protein n=1 Tax=Antedon mediterranea TaxID=105859 RepID=UPI003AF57384